MTIAVIFAIYLISQAFIGVIFYNKTKNMSDFALGGRKLNSWVTAMSAQASDMSGWLLIGLPGLAYIVYQGTSEALWIAIGLALGTYLNWLFVAKKLRKYTEISNDSLTLPDFFENRFQDKKHILRGISAIFTVIFFLIYTAAQFSAGAKLFSTIFGLPYTVGLIIGTLIILSYTAFGGFSAVCWADTVQGTIMFFALIIVPIIACSDMGGFSQVAARLSEIATDSWSLLPMKQGNLDTLLLASALGWGLGYFGQPHILVRFMAIESPDQIKKSRVVAMVWVLITLSAAVSIGLIGKAYMPNLADGETIYMDMIHFMFNDVVSGLLLIAILAAIMSTASSQLLVTASSVSTDLYGLISKKKMDEMTMVWMSRFTVIVVAAVAILLALNPNSSVFSLVSCAWGGFGAAFGPLILFSLFWRRATVQGAIAGMVAGGISDLLWYYLKNIAKLGGIFNIYEIIPGFIIASLGIVIVSLITTPNEKVLAEFDSVK
ncbi:sodium/proline symporter PutP [Sinanaerobacter sp. ZZT-01]|uniref:sodium/proline symporter PutP n=1 Tax=Sinanaerobacter sp. ZZT-01 TaxID=3111540 RepID=UPI002D796334|nr:sodium/proline symporter PutP [Sinanaerobacter sp. ZZT-01]WRR94692.1 sodium/proline symporter PutP [Sinanaerobacter sp. ZZT-01]